LDYPLMKEVKSKYPELFETIVEWANCQNFVSVTLSATLGFNLWVK
jgi:hypothetical protein